MSESAEMEAELEALSKHPWYHGLMPRSDCEEAMKENGNYLVRVTEKLGSGVNIILSYRWKNEYIHLILIKSDVRRFGTSYRTYHMAERDFSSVLELVNFYKHSKHPFYGALLAHSVPRKPWFICHKDVELHDKIGEGYFGGVYTGRLIYGVKSVPIVAKACKSVAAEDRSAEFIKEAKIMLNYRHENLAIIYAVVADKPPPMVVMEHCPEGTLDRYLHKWAGRVLPPEKVRLCAQAASGMEYLHTKKNALHLHLSTRNCFVGTRNVLKLGNFALTRPGPVHRVDQGQFSASFRWMAPESLECYTLSKESNAWSLGVLVWEIFADAQEPWPGLSLPEVLAAMKASSKMAVPPTTPDSVVRVMHATWSLEPIFRPNMSQLHLVLDRIDRQLSPRNPPLPPTPTPTT